MISNECSINFRLIVIMCIKPHLCVVTHAILTLWHRSTNCKSCSLRPELLGASSPPHRGQPLYGTRGPVRRHEDKVVYWSRITVLSLSLLSASHRLPWPLIRNTWVPYAATTHVRCIIQVVNLLHELFSMVLTITYFRYFPLLLQDLVTLMVCPWMLVIKSQYFLFIWNISQI